MEEKPSQSWWSIFKVSWVTLALGQGHDLGFVCLLGAHTLSIA